MEESAMSEAERRRGYSDPRVLLETARVLDPQFSDGVLYITGAQLEMLRSLCQYLRRPGTFVTEYSEGFYLTPTTEEWDDLQAIVADLEETLMGNPNTLWGYVDRWVEQVSEQEATAGTNILSFAEVPEGYVYTLDLLGAVDVNTAVSIVFQVTDGVVGCDFVPSTPMAPGAWLWQFPIVLSLKAGDVVKVIFYGCTLGDDLYARLWGTMMSVS